MLSINRDLTREFEQRPKKDFLKAFLSAALQKNLPLAIYRLPDKKEIIGLIDFNKSDTQKKRAGFVVSPFRNDLTSIHFIQADFQFRIENESIHFREDGLNENPELISFLEYLDTNTNYTIPEIDSSVTDYKNNYISITQRAIEKIKEGAFKKIVLARQKQISLNVGMDLIDLFLSLAIQQKDSFISLFYLPGHAIWIGASPEILVSRTKDDILRTVALAATQKAVSDDICKAVWTQKEIEEQALVARYIINCFKSIRLREFEENGPKTVRSGNLLHLKTEFSVNIKEVGFDDLENQLINLLHPTSAVCGMPKEEALNFIHKHEGMDRKFYSGYLGPVNMEQESHIFVNLRCAEITNNTAILYSGAGITEESNPTKEFEETELKMQFLENLLLNIK